MDCTEKIVKNFEKSLEQPQDAFEEAFVVDDMAKAEWATKQIAQRQAQIKALQDYAAKRIADTERMLQEQIEPLQKDVNYFTELLRPFVAEELAKRKKGKSFKLFNGAKLGLKANQPTYSYDDDELMGFFANNGYDEYIDSKIVVKPKWGDFKKVCSVKEVEKTDEDGNEYKELALVINETGEIVNQVKVTPAEPDKLSVDVKGIEL